MTFRSKTIRSLKWSSLGAAFVQLIGFVTSVILARLLNPSDFGTLAMVLVFTQFAAIFGDMGFSKALIQRQRIGAEHIDAVFCINLASGAALAAIIYLLSSPIASLFDQPLLEPITEILSIVFIINSFALTQSALLQRQSRFKMISGIETTASFTSSGIAIVLAAIGFGLMSLVIQQILNVSIKCILLWRYGGARPRLRFSKSAALELSRFSANLVGFQVFNYWIRNTDNFLIGKFAGADALGLYNRAYSLMLLPTNILQSAASRVMFPAFSEIQDDPTRVRELYLKANRLIALIVMPTMLLLLVAAEPFVLTVYGEKWALMTPLLQLLCLVGLKQPMGSTTGWIFMSQGRTDLQFRWGLINGLVTIFLFIAATPWGSIGIAIAYVIRGYGLWYFAQTIPGRLIGLGFSEYISNLASIAALSGVMGAIVYVAGIQMEQLAPAIRLLAMLTVGSVCYAMLVLIVKPRAYRDAIDLFSDQNPFRQRRSEHT